MTARRIVLSAALLSAVAVLPVSAQDPSPPAEAPAVKARSAVERAPRNEPATRSESARGERRAPSVPVREPRTSAPAEEAQPRRKPDAPVAASATTSGSASAAAEGDDEQGGRRSGGSRGSGRVTRGDGAVPRQGGVRNPDIDRGAGAVGQAVPRSRAPRPSGSWGTSGRRYYGGPRGFGYYVYDPWSWYGYGYGWPAYGAYYGAWNGGWGGYYGGGGGAYGGPYGWSIGGIRLKVDPNDAEVYVDGYYAGIIDDFDGIWQQLRLDDGGYRVEVRKRGFETLVFDVRVQPGRTITYRGRMVPGP